MHPIVQWSAVAALAVAASRADLRTRRVPNVLTFGAASAGLLLWTFAGGFSGLAHSALGWLLGLALFFPLFAVAGMGAGDLKLLAAFGALLGPTGALSTALISAIVGGLMAFVIGAATGYLGDAFRNLGVILTTWRIAGISPIPGITLQDAR